MGALAEFGAGKRPWVAKDPTMRYLKWMFLLLLVSPWVLADMGPKPTMTWKFHFPAGSKLTAVSGTLLECPKADGKIAAPLAHMGPQRFECSATECFALAYGFQPYHILEIKFSDGKTRRSEVFATGAFDAVFQVEVQENDLRVVFDPKESTDRRSRVR